MSNPKKIPEWQTRLNGFRQRFPGDGFNHEFHDSLELDAPGSDERRINCPCGQSAILLTRKIIRAKGAVDVLTCPQCASWHVVTWQMELNARVMGGKFIFVGKLK